MDLQANTPPVARKTSRYSVKEAAGYCDVSVAFLNRSRLTGDGPEYLKLGSKPGSKVMYEAPALDAWLASRRRRSTSQKEAA